MRACPHFSRGARPAALLALLACLALLSGCQAQLFDNLREDEANAVIAALQEDSIPASKAPGTEGTFRVMIDENDFARAMRVLTAAGLPGRRFDDLGRIFGKESMFSTPMEEKARYLYAMQEELAHTISTIDGVLAARVHLVLPEQDQLGREMQKPSAAVMIKYADNGLVDTEANRPEIRRIIAASVPNIDEERIVIGFFPSIQEPARPPARSARQISLLGLKLSADPAGDLWWLAAGGALLGCGLGAGVVWGILSGRKKAA